MLTTRITIHMQRLHADLEEREAQLKAKEEEMKQKDAEISRLVGELRRCQEIPRQVSYRVIMSIKVVVQLVV